MLGFNCYIDSANVSLVKEATSASYLFIIMAIPHESQLILSDSKLKDNLLSAFYFYIEKNGLSTKII